jgi:hypothetical protein
MGISRYVALFIAGAVLDLPAIARAEDSVFAIGRLVTEMREMIGKPLLDKTIEFNNKSPFVLESLAPEGSRFFFGGSSKQPGESADDMRQKHGFIIIMTPCPGAHDFSAKVASVAAWETISGGESMEENVQQMGLGIEQLLAMMNSPPGVVVTPSTLRVPRVKNLRGPVFEYVRGDTTETLSFLNEGSPLRITWTITNTGICPR